MLSTPPAFILSQDQPLIKKFVNPMSEIILACIFPNHLYCYWFVGSLMLSLIRRSWNSCLEFQGCHVVNFSRFLYALILSMSNGEGGIWTLAPLLTAYSLSRGAPSTAWVLLQYQALELSLCMKVSGERGIRTLAPFRTNGFQDRLVMTASISLQKCA